MSFKETKQVQAGLLTLARMAHGDEGFQAVADAMGRVGDATWSPTLASEIALNGFVKALPTVRQRKDGNYFVDGSPDADLKIFELQARSLLNAIGIVVRDGQLWLTVKLPSKEVQYPLGDNTHPYLRTLMDWMLRKQELLHDKTRLEGTEDEAAVGPDAAPDPAWAAWDGTPFKFGIDSVRSGRPGPVCPVAPGTRIRVRFRDGEEQEVTEPEQMRWAWTRPYVAGADIVAYQLVMEHSHA